MELRIHGIGGPSAESVLAAPGRDDIASDVASDGAFAYSVWRSEPAARSAVRALPEDGDVGVYHWAPLTSGSRFFALWPVLLCFTLVNVAGWMHAPSADGVARGGRAVRAIVTALGLALTVATATWLFWLGQVLVGHRALRGMPASLAAIVGAAAAAVAVGLIVVIATYSAHGYERFRPAADAPVPRRPRPVRTLASPRLYDDANRHRWSWRAHVAVLVATVTGCIVLLVREPDRAARAHALADVSAVVTVVQIGLLGLLGLVGLAHRAGLRASPRYVALGPFAAATLGSTLPGALAVSGAWTAVGAANLPPDRSLMLFDTFGWSLLAALLAAAAAVVARLATPVPGESDGHEVTAADDTVGSDPAARTIEPPKRLLPGTMSVLRARLATAPGHLDAAVVAFAATAVVVGTIAAAVRWEDGGRGQLRLPDTPATTLARLTVLALVGFMVATVWRTRADSASLRRIGNLWDVLTFWPRDFHPFAVRSYAERAVPELQSYVRGHANEPLTILAHSQGSVLAYAALLPSGAPGLAHVTLVTFGSPLRALYARFFPAYVSARGIRSLRDALGGRWTNVYRLTDHVGRAVFADDAAIAAGGDVPLPDPPRPGMAIVGHSGYWRDPAIRQRVVPAAAGTTERGGVR